MNNLPSSPDVVRDATRYGRLVRALDHAAREIREVEQTDAWDIDAVLAKFLPDMVEAVDAEQAVVANLFVSDANRQWMQLTAVYPDPNLHGQRLELVGRLLALIKDGKPRVITALGEYAPKPI